MNEDKQAKSLAAWLEKPDRARAPTDVDPEVLEAIYALNPELAPPPRVTADEILALVTEGPLASAAGAVVEFPMGASVAAGAQTQGDTLRTTPAANRPWYKVFAGGGIIGALAAAAVVLLVLTPALDQADKLTAAPGDGWLPNERTAPSSAAEEATSEAPPPPPAMGARQRSEPSPEVVGRNQKMEDKEPVASGLVAEDSEDNPSDIPPLILPSPQTMPPSSPDRKAEVMRQSKQEASTTELEVTALEGSGYLSTGEGGAFADAYRDDGAILADPQAPTPATATPEEPAEIGVRSTPDFASGGSSYSAPPIEETEEESDYGAVADLDDEFAFEAQASSPTSKKSKPKADQDLESKFDPADLDLLRSDAMPDDLGGWRSNVDQVTLARIEEVRSAAETHGREGRPAVAAETLMPIIASPLRAGQQAAIDAASYAWRAGDLRGALDLASRGMSLGSQNTPERSMLLRLRGDALRAMGDNDGAEGAYTEAIRLNRLR